MYLLRFKINPTLIFYSFIIFSSSNSSIAADTYTWEVNDEVQTTNNRSAKLVTKSLPTSTPLV
jgi:hypothetical protein